MKIKKSVIADIHESAQLIMSLHDGKHYTVTIDPETPHEYTRQETAVEMASTFAEHICDAIDQHSKHDFWSDIEDLEPDPDAPNIPSADELEDTVISLYQAMADIRDGLVKGSRQGDDLGNIVDTAIDLLNLQLADLDNDDLGASAIEEADNAQ